MAVQIPAGICLFGLGKGLELYKHSLIPNFPFPIPH